MRSPARAAALLWALIGAAILGCSGAEERSDEDAVVRVAVAANFLAAQQELAIRFERETGIHVTSSAGATGQLYAQIVNGAPFDVFLAADAERPRRLVESGAAVAESRFTYATGRLALYGPRLDSVRVDAADLRDGRALTIAVANPRTAPYGAAAIEALRALGIDTTALSIARGTSIGQTHQFVRSGGADLGFVALSQVVGEPRHSYWLVPEALHTPILQDAVLLSGAASVPRARAFLDFLHGEAAREVIHAFGYGTDAPSSRPAPGR